MDIFVSWSGERSRVAGEALKDWLPQVIQALTPWSSAETIPRSGAAGFGIICLTAENLHHDAILFEAGALSGTLENRFICGLLLDLEADEVAAPLSRFELIRAEKREIRKLLSTLNSILSQGALSEPRLEASFQKWWPDLEQKLVSSRAAEEPVRMVEQQSSDDLIAKLTRAAQTATEQAGFICDLSVRQIQTNFWIELRTEDGRRRGQTHTRQFVETTSLNDFTTLILDWVMVVIAHQAKATNPGGG